MSYTYEYPRPTVTTDAVIFRLFDEEIQVLLIKRLKNPFKSMWAIPGGFIELDEELEQSAYRELKEETGITGVELHQFGVYGKVNRDPRHRTISVAYTGFIGSKNISAQASDDAEDCEWFSFEAIPVLAFDHNKIVTDAIHFASNAGWFRQ